MQKAQLFLLHFAGGNCHSFQFMTSYLRDFEVIPLELPGRGRRMGEKLVKEFDQAALDFYNQIARKQSVPHFMIYGHSMGAYLTLRVSNMLESAGRPPMQLFVSGNAGPGVREPKNTYLLEKDGFIRELKKLGGLPDEFFLEKELFELFEPILRADFEIAEKTDLKNEPATNAPLFAMMGNKEEYVKQISNWGKYTRSRFGFEIMEGDHFFIRQHPEKIAFIIRHCYSLACQSDSTIKYNFI